MKRQGGYTLVELIIALAIGVLLMSAVSSVVLTAWRASTIAGSRVEASSQVRNFQQLAYDDFASGGAPPTVSCGTPSTPCTTQPLVLNGIQASNSTSPVTSPYQVTYSWDGSDIVDRQIGSGGPLMHAATNVSAFSWYVDTNSTSPTVVVKMTVTVGTYSQSQTFRFYPRMNP